VVRRLIHVLGIGLALAIFLIVLRVGVGLRPSAGSQGDAAEIIQAKFETLNIPLKSVRILNESPLEVEVILQEPASQPSEITWERYIARRVLNDAWHSLGIPLATYYLKITDSEGTIGYNVYADLRLMQVRPTPNPPSASTIGDREAESSFLQELNFQDIKLKSLDVRNELSLDANTRLLQVNLSLDTKDMTAANHQIDNSLGDAA